MKITDEDLLTVTQVSRIFSVDPKTVTRWAVAGKLTTVRTLGGHRRYYAAEVYRLRDASREDRTDG